MKHLLAVRRLLPAVLGLLLVLALPPHTPAVPFTAGDDTKIGGGTG